MVDVSAMPARSFGFGPTPARVAPFEFAMPRAAFEAMGGPVEARRPLSRVLAEGGGYGGEFRRVPPPGGG